MLGSKSAREFFCPQLLLSAINGAVSAAHAATATVAALTSEVASLEHSATLLYDVNDTKRLQ